MQLRATIADPVAVLDLTTGNDRIVLGGVAGTIKLILTDEETAALTAPATYVYDLELADPDGKVTRLLRGSVTIDPEVTRIP